MELLHSMLLTLLLLVVPWPVGGSQMARPRDGETNTATTGYDHQMLVELQGHQHFIRQVGALLANQDRVASPLFSGKRKTKLSIDAWSTVPLFGKSLLPDFASSVASPSDQEKARKFSSHFGYTAGYRSLIVSSEYGYGSQSSGKKNATTKRSQAKDFVTMEAFKRVASRSSDPTVELGEGGWAVGLCHDPENFQVTLISVGPVGLHLILMEEDPEDGLLKPCYMAEADARRVVQLRTTPDGSHLRKYYLLVAEEAFLEHAAEFTPQVPKRLDDMKTLIEAGCQKILPHPRTPVVLLISLQKTLPQAEEKDRVPAIRGDDGEGPEQLNHIESGAIRDCGHFTQTRSKSWKFRRGSLPRSLPYPVKSPYFDRISSTLYKLTNLGDHSTEKYAVALRAKTILFCSRLVNSTKIHGATATRDDVLPDFRTKGGFRRGARIDANDGSAVGVQFDERERTLTLARFGRPPLVILVFRETPSGEMKPIVRVLGGDQLVELAVEEHAEGGRTYEHWLVFVGPSAVGRLDSIAKLKAGVDGFDEAIRQMFDLIDDDDDADDKELSCKEHQLIAVRLGPVPFVPEVASVNGSASRTAGTATACDSNRSLPLPGLVSVPPPAQAESPQAIVQILPGIRSNIYYVGFQLNSVASQPPAHYRLSRHHGIYVAEDVLVASRNLHNTENGRNRLDQLIATDSQSATVKTLFKGRGDTLRVILDRAAGRLCVRSRGEIPLVLIRLWAGRTGELQYKEVLGDKQGRRIKIKPGTPTIYAVVSRKLLPYLPRLANTLKMPRNEAELVKLASILNQDEQALGSNDADLREWDVRVALFPMNIPWQGAIRGDETTDSDAELGGEDGMSSGTDVDEDRH